MSVEEASSPVHSAKEAGITADELVSLFTLETVKVYGAQKVFELHALGLRLHLLLDNPSLLPSPRLRGDTSALR